MSFHKMARFIGANPVYLVPNLACRAGQTDRSDAAPYWKRLAITRRETLLAGDDTRHSHVRRLSLF